MNLLMFQESIWIFPIFFTLRKFLSKFWTINVIRIWDFFVRRFRSIHSRIFRLIELHNSFTVRALNFFQKRSTQKRKKNWRNSYEFWKPKNSFETENEDLIIYRKFVRQFFDSFGIIIILKKILNIFYILDLFQICGSSRSTQILIESDICLGMYVPYILELYMCIYAYVYQT